MKTKFLAIAAAGLITIGTAGVSRAVMVSPQSVIHNSMGFYKYYYVPERMIDHSGLLTDFTSGETELSNYLQNFETGHAIDAKSGFVSNFTTSGIVDFDLGASYTLQEILLWTDIDYQAINHFKLFIDEDSSFSTPTLLGEYSASYGAVGGAIPMQKFSLIKGKGRYVRLQVFDIHKSGTQIAQIAEIAFDTAAPPDPDEDGVQNDLDNCPNVFNPDQANFDDDEFGNACDPDDDNDGLADEEDNCQYDFNPAQSDYDGDGVGDVCDMDVDGDLVIDADDECLETAFGEMVNDKGCSVGEICPCDNEWINHGKYVSCVTLALDDFVANGLLSEEEKGDLVSEAGASSCGKKNKKKKKNK